MNSNKERVICKDGRVFHACEVCRKRRSRCDGLKPKCTSCLRRGLECEYRAMRKRGRHGKKTHVDSADSVEPHNKVSSSLQSLQNQQNTTDEAAAMAAAAAAVWSLTSPPLQQPSTARTVPASADSATFNLLDSLPRLFSLPPEMASSQQQQQQQQQQYSTANSPTSAPAAAVPINPMIGAIGQPLQSAQNIPPYSMAPTSSVSAAVNMHPANNQHQDHHILASVLSPPITAVSDSLQMPPNITSAFLSSIDSSSSMQYLQQQQQQQQQPYRSRPASGFLSSPSPNSSFSQTTQPSLAFRSMSASSSGTHMLNHSMAAITTSLSGITSPIGLGSVLESPALSMQFSSHHPPQAQQQQQQQSAYNPLSSSASAAAAAAAAAAVAAFQFSPSSASPAQHQAFTTTAGSTQSQQQPQVAAFLSSPPMTTPLSPSATLPILYPANVQPPVPASRSKSEQAATGHLLRRNSLEARANASPLGKARRNSTTSTPNSAAVAAKNDRGQQRRRRQGGDWSRTILEEDEVLDGLRSDGADHFGRPMFDVKTYPLPPKSELDEHVNGMFEYFYMGVQTLHAPTFRQRVAQGDVSPVLIYAIMAVASRYSRRPSLHSLNGMAFLNGDRHAATACGLASILLNHGDLGTVDTIHAMLFLSVYFMGQGNMLKSRMYLVKAVCTARTMGFQNIDATFVPSNPMVAFSGTFDRRPSPPPLPGACPCARSSETRIELETKRRIWWFLVFVDYFTANVMNVPLEIPPDSYCVRLPCSDGEWVSPTLQDAPLTPDPPPRDLGFGDSHASAQQGPEYLRLNGFHDCRPPWPYRPGAFYLERLMVEFCDHLRRLNSLRALAIRSFFHAEPVYIDENYPYLKRRRQFVPWPDRLEKVKSSWSWLHLQLNKWLDSILLRFSEVINRVPSDRYNRQYRHQYYYYLLAAHSTIIMSHGVILQLHSDFARYLARQHHPDSRETPAPSHTPMPHLTHPSLVISDTWASPAAEFRSNVALSEGLSEFAIGTLGSSMAPLINYAQNMASSSSAAGSSLYGSVIGSPVSANHSGGMSNNGANSRAQSIAQPFADDTMPVDFDARSFAGSYTSSAQSSSHAAAAIQRDLTDMAVIAWDGCVSTAEQLASILRGKHPKFVLLGGPPVEVFHEQVLSGDANILSAPGSAFNAPGTGPGADNPILSDPDFYMRLQPSTAWWMFLVAQVQVGHIKRLLKESEGSFKVSARRKAYQAKMAAARAAAAAATTAVNNNQQPNDPEASSVQPEASSVQSEAAMQVDQAAEAEILGMHQRLQKPADQMRPLSTSVNNSAVMLATAVHLSDSAPQPPNKQAMEKRADIKTRAARLVRAYENLSCMVKVLEGMQQYWQCMDYVSVIQEILKGSEHPLH
ncbi:hypothetical protein IWW36_001066 [Coemansia brasiliensis]|uniref:Zn(2)-C6 fungal-type domain-containing protein n=1 Tax=Coemansia brasiliensis TaxID=2650707 RepID=A0A9W8M2A7_9FUNG|nr:hypothetical protein IWW36_001066 [Coemansia brasiliensis]